MNIFIAKLSPGTTSEDLKTLFGEYGDVLTANVISDKFTGFSKRFGFVEMQNDAEAFRAINELNECEFDHSQIVVKKAVPKEELESRGGYSDNRRGNNNRY